MATGGGVFERLMEVALENRRLLERSLDQGERMERRILERMDQMERRIVAIEDLIRGVAGTSHGRERSIPQPEEDRAGDAESNPDQLMEITKHELQDGWDEEDSHEIHPVPQMPMESACDLQKDPGNSQESSTYPITRNSEDGSSEQSYFSMLPDVIECGICNNTFHTVSEFDEHIADHEKDQAGSNARRRSMRRRTETQTGDSATNATDNITGTNEDTQSEQNGRTARERKRRGQKERHCCQFCVKVFKHKCRLEDHMTVHTGDRPFICEVCQRNFREKSKLKRHLRMHTGEKPFECEYCRQTFTRSDTLLNHVRAAHDR